LKIEDTKELFLNNRTFPRLQNWEQVIPYVMLNLL
jgi:hypothetical protein